jgi:sec-independent protein translocase protein TatB
MFPEGRALEFLLAAVIALVVVGPKDLPVLMRKLGQFLGKMRSLAAEFRASFDEMARQSELDELRKEVDAMRRAQFADVAARTGAQDAISDIRQNLGEVGSELRGEDPPPYYMGPSEPVGAPEPVAAAEPQATAPARRKAPAKPRAKKTAGPDA